MVPIEGAMRTLHWSTSKTLILAVLGISALCTAVSVDAVPEKVHLVFSNHLVSSLPFEFVLRIQLSLKVGFQPVLLLRVLGCRIWVSMASTPSLGQMTMSSTSTSQNISLKL